MTPGRRGLPAPRAEPGRSTLAANGPVPQASVRGRVVLNDPSTAGVSLPPTGHPSRAVAAREGATAPSRGEIRNSLQRQGSGHPGSVRVAVDS